MKWAEAIPLTHVNEKVVIQFIEHQLITRFGMPLLHIIFVIPMIVNDVNLYVAFRGVSGLSS
jgi:hypothetical protein